MVLKQSIKEQTISRLNPCIFLRYVRVLVLGPVYFYKPNLFPCIFEVIKS